MGDIQVWDYLGQHCSSMNWSITGKCGLEAVASIPRNLIQCMASPLPQGAWENNYELVLEAAASGSLCGLAMNRLQEKCLSVGHENYISTRDWDNSVNGNAAGEK